MTTFKHATSIAKKIFKKENIPVYIFKVQPLFSKKYDYIVSKYANVVITDDSTAELVKFFKPDNKIIEFNNIKKYMKDHNMNFYIKDNIIKKYYKLDYIPNLIEYIKNTIYMINSENSIIEEKDSNNFFIAQIESYERLCKKHGWTLFDKDFTALENTMKHIKLN